MTITATRGSREGVLFINDYLPQEMLGIMWLSRAIKDAGHETKALFLPDKDWIAEDQGVRPGRRLLLDDDGDAPVLPRHREASQGRGAAEVVLSVFGGPHATFSPELVGAHEHVDAICRGEGEHAIVEFLDHLANGTPYWDVMNMWFRNRETGEIVEEHAASAGPEPRLARVPRPRHHLRGGRRSTATPTARCS
jgi:hypothetical protein